jgi:two-component system, NarL family, nitrate/nitrite response regulator NarL
MNKIDVAFVDDHPVLLEGICSVFSRRERFNVVARGDCADDARAIAAQFQPDLVFVDLNMGGDVFAAIQEISSSAKRTKVVVYSAYTGTELVLQALDSGASGFVSKHSISDELFGAVDAVLRGETFVSPSCASKVLSGLRNRSTHARTGQAAQLSQREREVVHELLNARSNKEIARKMSISEKTVKHYMTNLMSKLQARNRVEVALAARGMAGMSTTGSADAPAFPTFRIAVTRSSRAAS